MVAQGVRPETPEERLIFWAIAGTWGLWLLGALYVVGALLGYVLLAIVALRSLGILETPREAPAGPPLSVLLWCGGMLAMLAALVAAHYDFELGLVQTLKSAVGWAKGWALLAVFPLVGATMAIRPAILTRATAIVGLQTLLIAPILLLAEPIGLPQTLYVSPLSIVGGPGSEFFDVPLYAIDDTTGRLRWRFFSPWSTAAALLACMGLVLAIYEREWRWRLVGIAAAVVVCLMTGSRLAVIALPATVLIVLALANLTRPGVWIALAFGLTAAVLMSDTLMAAYGDANDVFTGARAASSRVRAALARIALDRWENEAPVFGHGIVERGGHVVQFMPIGSHHTWRGLLFVKGAVGFLALALPLGCSLVALALKAQADRVARAGLGMLVSLVLFSFADNLEIVAYLIWPGLVLVGIALARPLRSPLVGYLGGMPRVAFTASA